MCSVGSITEVLMHARSARMLSCRRSWERETGLLAFTGVRPSDGRPAVLVTSFLVLLCCGTACSFPSSTSARTYNKLC